MSWDEPPSLRDAEDGLGMAVVVVDRQRGGPIDPSDHNFIHSIKPTFP
jgi:hypothetical protein